MKSSSTIINDLKKVKLYNKSSIKILQNYTRNGKVNVLKDEKHEFLFLEKTLTAQNNFYKNRYHKVFPKKKIWKQNFYGKEIKITRLNENFKRYNFLKKNIINKKVLDFGCGFGEFANEISRYTKKTYAYEKSEICKKYIRNNLKKINVLNSLSEFDNFFDSIVLIHSFHYLTEPLEYLYLLKKKLKPRGKLIIEVPSSNDILLSKFNLKEFKDFTFCIENLIWHNDITLKKFLKKVNFKKIRIYPFQRHNLNNHLGWLMYGKPGGHEYLKTFCSKKQLDDYENFLKKKNFSDTLIAIAER